MNQINDINKINKNDVEFKKIVEDKKRRVNKKLKIINSRLTRKFKNNFSQTFNLNRINKFIINVHNKLNELQNECHLYYLKHFTLDFRL